MSASTVIGDATQTLQELLKNEQQPKELFAISLESPAEETVETSMQPKISLYLFRVAENMFAKNQDWQPIGTEILHYPPLALDLFYILTPFAENKLDEQRILGEAMRVLYDHSIIKAPLLKGVLENSEQELKVDLCQFSLEDLARIWSAFNKPYRLSVCYELRIVMMDSLFEQTVRRVTEKEDRFSQL